MNTFCKRFSRVSIIILNNLDDQSLNRSKKVSRGVFEILEKERFYWVRIIKSYAKKFEKHEESWNEVLNKTPVYFIKELAFALYQYFEFNDHDEIAPLHIAALKGSFQLCQYIIAKTKNKNPIGIHHSDTFSHQLVFLFAYIFLVWPLALLWSQSSNR